MMKIKTNPSTRAIIGIAVIEDDPFRPVGSRSILDVVPGFHVIATPSP
jgi:hypothetical protein